MLNQLMKLVCKHGGAGGNYGPPAKFDFDAVNGHDEPVSPP